MSHVIQAFWILFFYLLGMGISFLIGGLIPGSVIGMLLLFLALSLGYLKESHVSGVANALLKNMVLFFLPAAVGLIASIRLVMDNLWAIAVSTIISTIIVIITVALIQQKMGRKQSKNNSGKDHSTTQYTINNDL